jgi:hypothetical protein
MIRVCRTKVSYFSFIGQPALVQKERKRMMRVCMILSLTMKANP